MASAETLKMYEGQYQSNNLTIEALAGSGHPTSNTSTGKSI
jgi:hypothetical protein